MNKRQQIIAMAKQASEPLCPRHIATTLNCSLAHVRNVLWAAGIEFKRDVAKSNGKYAGVGHSFDSGDSALIKALLDSGESMQSIADKWGVTLLQLILHCEQQGINIPGQTFNNELAQKVLQLRATGLAKVRIAKGLSVCIDYVRKIIDTNIKDDHLSRHIARIERVTNCAKQRNMTAKAACQFLGIELSNYGYSRWILKKSR